MNEMSETKHTKLGGQVHRPKTVAPRQSDLFHQRLCNEASEIAVATVIDPTLPPPPTTLSRYRKGKHRKGRR